jgi:hypothetical protein
LTKYLEPIITCYRNFFYKKYFSTKKIIFFIFFHNFFYRATKFSFRSPTLLFFFLRNVFKTCSKRVVASYCEKVRWKCCQSSWSDFADFPEICSKTFFAIFRANTKPSQRLRNVYEVLEKLFQRLRDVFKTFSKLFEALETVSTCSSQASDMSLT